MARFLRPINSQYLRNKMHGCCWNHSASLECGIFSQGLALELLSIECVFRAWSCRLILGLGCSHVITQSCWLRPERGSLGWSGTSVTFAPPLPRCPRSGLESRVAVYLPNTMPVSRRHPPSSLPLLLPQPHSCHRHKYSAWDHVLLTHSICAP